jgi:hypothetical protein
LAQDFADAEATGERRDLVDQLTQVDLLVLEDLGMKKLGPSAAEDLLEIFVRRHKTASTLITTPGFSLTLRLFGCRVRVFASTSALSSNRRTRNLRAAASE